jgi:hypothetical protein
MLVELECMARLVDIAEAQAFNAIEARYRARKLYAVPSSDSTSCSRISTYDVTLPLSTAS